MDTALLIACPHCQTLNRVPSAKLREAPNCGRCKSPLFSGEVLPLDARNFDRHADADLPLIVDFWADWCAPCRAMAPNFAQVCRQMEPRARFAKLDTEREGGLAQRYAIRSIPTLILFHRGQELARQSGALDTNSLKRWLELHLPKI